MEGRSVKKGLMYWILGQNILLNLLLRMYCLECKTGVNISRTGKKAQSWHANEGRKQQAVFHALWPWFCPDAWCSAGRAAIYPYTESGVHLPRSLRSWWRKGVLEGLKSYSNGGLGPADLTKYTMPRLLDIHSAPPNTLPRY